MVLIQNCMLPSQKGITLKRIRKYVQELKPFILGTVNNTWIIRTRIFIAGILMNTFWPVHLHVACCTREF